MSTEENDPLVGKRIVLLAMPGDPNPIEIGEQGEVERVFKAISGVQQIAVKWDSGRSLMLAVPPDRYRVIDEEKGQNDGN